MRLITKVSILITCLCICFPLHSQNKEVEIKGVVMDDDGLPAMSIVIKDKTIEGKVYGITDLDGNFKIMADPETTLHLSGLTYAPKTLKLNGKRQVSVVISYESQRLSEVVITAKRIVQKITPEPTDIEVVGNQYIIRPKVKIPKKLFDSESRIIVQPVLVNITKKTKRLFRPAAVAGRKYMIALERMLEFEPSSDPLHSYYTKSKQMNDYEMISYADSLFLENPEDECRCDIFIYLVKYSKKTYQDTVVIAKGTVNPMRFFDPNIIAKHVTDKKHMPRPQKQMRGDKGQVNLTFLVSTARIDNSVPENTMEMNKMREKLGSIENDPAADFTSFNITGVSSPEGSYDANLRLAQKRTQTAKDMILSFLRPGTVSAMRDSITTDARVESWERVAELMERDSLPTREIREILTTYQHDPTLIFRNIVRLPEYGIIKDKYLKQLRRVEYGYNYSVLRLLTDDEIKQIYRKNYKQLTKYEFWRMFINAQTKAEKEKICRQAIEVYPDFMLMANELAVILIDRKQPDVALLKPFIKDDTPEELVCNHIIALLHEREYTQVDSIANLLPLNRQTEDIKILARAYNGDYQAGYDCFATRGGVNEVVLLLALKRNEEAYDKAEGLPDNALSYYLRAAAANRLEKLTEAFAYLKRAIAEDAGYKDIARIDGDLAEVLQQIEQDAKEQSGEGSALTQDSSDSDDDTGKTKDKQKKKRKGKE